ncbi:MAG: 4Fe-4S binding protein [Methanobacteriaceae archaeon]|nr:4Fe-4S binding protein [Methanobacteriaceae archaeon]
MNINELIQDNISKTPEQGGCCCGGLGKSYPDTSKIENPKTNNDEISAEFLDELEKYVKKLGILHIGYLNDLEKHHLNNPEYDYNNAIVLTIEMDERILEEGAGDIAQEYNDQLYEHFGNLTYQVSDYIRKEGYKTLVAHPYEEIVDFSKLGEAAGLGAIGKSGLLISPEHGPKQKISAILVKIENLPEREYKYQWIRKYCDYCGRCVKFCPQKAIIDFKTMNNISFDSSKCIGCSQGCTECIKTCPFYNKGYIETRKKYDKIISRVKK